jgi:hypothetical protein
MISKELEEQFKGKTVKTKSGDGPYTVLGAFATDAAGLVLVVVGNANGKAILDTFRVTGCSLEILP